MKRTLGLGAVLAMAMSLGGCQPDQETRLTQACTNSMMRLMKDGSLEKICGCMARAAVKSLDRDTVEYMIGFYERGPDSSSMADARAQKMVAFELSDHGCFDEMGIKSAT